MPTPTTVAITLAVPAPPGLADELSEDFGVYPSVEDRARGVDPASAGVVVATAVGLFLGGMIQQFGAEAADRLMRGLGRLWRAARRTDHDDIWLVDEVDNIVIVLSVEAIADRRAIAALLAWERQVFQPDAELRWSPADGRWQAGAPGDGR
jgi:hypothetical protein